jgi:ABC-2 type transport system ATP-binding protein
MSDAICLENVTKRLGGREVLKNVGFTVARGDIFGYLGPNGAGKTTTIRVLLGLLKPTSGDAFILGENVQKDSVRKKVGFVLDADGLYDNMTGYENIRYYASIYDVPQPEDKINRAIKMVELSDRAKDKVAAYSKGMRQRLALARAVVHDPGILILDEPTAGIDPSGQIQVRQIILNMAHNEGKTIFFSSHNLDEVHRVCNRIALINRGEIRLYGELEKLQKEMSRPEVTIEIGGNVQEAILTEMTKTLGAGIKSQENSALTLSLKSLESVPDIIAFLAGHGVRIEEVKHNEASLEEIYTSILKEAGETL